MSILRNDLHFIIEHQEKLCMKKVGLKLEKQDFLST